MWDERASVNVTFEEDFKLMPLQRHILLIRHKFSEDMEGMENPNRHVIMVYLMRQHILGT